MERVGRTIYPAEEGAPFTVVVFGLYRGGTTMTARVVRRLGVPMGERVGVFGGGVTNEEDLDFRGADLATLERVARERDRTHAIWGFKDPLSTRRLPQLARILRRPRFVGITRDPWVSACTEERVGAFKDALAVMPQKLEDLTHILAFALEARRSGIPLYLAGYEKALAAPESFVREVAGFLGLAAREETLSRAASEIDAARGYPTPSI